MSEQPKDDNSLVLFGTEGNPYGKTMVGGADAVAINAMLQHAFDEKRAGLKDQPLTKIGQHKGRDIFEQQAADQIRLSLENDGEVYVKIIIRHNDPGMGLLAFAGGFKDSTDKSDEATAAREEQEEASDVKTADSKPVFVAKFEIPRQPVKGDIRQWGGKDRADGVTKGSIIALSTTAIVIVEKNARGEVAAGDDAQKAAWVPISKFDEKTAMLFGIRTHAEILVKALDLAEVPQSPSFGRALSARPEIIIATPEASAAAVAFMSSPEAKASYTHAAADVAARGPQHERPVDNSVGKPANDLTAR